MSELINAVLLAAAFMVLFAIAEAIHHWTQAPVELSRKFMHVAGGGLSLLMPVLFQHNYMVLVLAAAFFLLLWGSRRLGYLRSVHGVDRTTDGSILFPLPILLCFIWQGLAEEPLLFYLPVLVLTIADPMAYLVGSRFPWRAYRVGTSHKTLSGSIAFAVVTLLLLLLFLPVAPPMRLLAVGLAISVLAAVTEAVSGNGLDNLTVPVVVAALMHLSLGV